MANIIKKLTDKNGNPVRIVCSTPTSNQVKNAVLQLISSGNVVIDDLVGGGKNSNAVLDDEIFKSNANTALELITSELGNHDFYNIPLWVMTDTHNGLLAKGNYDIGEYIASISPSNLMGLFLGDICSIEYDETTLKNYRHHVDAFNKSISVIGNHDRNNINISGEIVDTSHSMINQWFLTNGFERFNDVLYGCYNDADFNVRYLVVNPYEIVPMVSGKYVTIGTSQMSWLIKNLTECDRDIIILMHQLFNDLHIHRDGTIQTWQDAPVVLENTWEMLKDRKNKRSGSITDSDGITHNYDFTNCTSDLLCCLHGHTHEELYIQDEGLLAYAFDYGHEKNCAFVSINRVENVLKGAQFNNTTIRDRIELSLSGKNSIINNLTNVTSSNMATTGVDTNSSYTTTLTATSGTLGSITVKMNGVDISSTAVSGNVVTIDNVVGRVEITASAS